MSDPRLAWDDKFKGFIDGAKKSMTDGAITDAYKANREEMINLLNRALASEWCAFLQYWHHYFMAADIHHLEIKEMFKEAADQELDHAQMLGDRIQLLGGVPCDKPGEIYQISPAKVDYCHDLRSMLQKNLIDERCTIAFYTELVRYAGFDDNTTRTMMEHILAEEEEHADQLANLLYALDASANKIIPDLHEQVMQQAQQPKRKVA